MGFNTVAVLYNDHTSEIRNSGRIGERMAEAMLAWAPHRKGGLSTNFGAGMVISVAHADYSQVVIVGRNWGQRACDATDVDQSALDEMKECLERHGYRVTKKRR